MRSAKRVRGVPDVTRVAPIIEGQVMATSNGASLGVLIHGMRRGDLASMPVVAENLSPGALQHYQGDDTVIIGEGLADKLRLAPGMTITLIAPRGNVTPFGVTPRIKTYTIAGTFKIGMSVYDSSYIFMPLEEAQLYFNMGKDVSALEVMITDPDKADDMANAIGNAAGPYARIVTWEDVNSAFFGAIQVERNVMFLILTLIILVAALNIVSGLIMLVKDKSPDIAILRTMGATRGAVMRVFMIAGASIGIAGTLARLHHRHAVLREYRIHSPGPLAPDRDDVVRSDDLFPRAHAGAHGARRGRRCRADGADAVVPRHALSRLARGAARSGGGAAL